ncbi:branched-chain amino acid ABC transporter permease [Rhizobium ruizarguesonis]|jgi:branched-chain amino acid transport system permease protein|uniref:Branched-chain amino acid ABC transporter permease n=1 Tax=Rhizobium ruizarguesonis TaxID=2081791 RepID=A0AAE8U3L0_9HYPH|nr:branched-chain amino acid ABC transporter permease [Rhizobium ruizarguesonis]MBY5830707.1 branched-chain amino acid ABC transporter permease [Rhizobium leguminosarum]NKL16450.1 branched-chain amino acid ABC transporter permease [Rhizobium leguminosarum bv. viciae]MBY5848121.1 branched-chain amino acid ABC transporter permease [Rhizobium leguminosarum]MBY5859411.1 branched-chain amino acid ABC transporter permease [Rhizobium leguminosarum]MBY5874152.1 branched-chain amino acid ABC transporte
MALVMNDENGPLQHRRGFITRDLIGIAVIIAIAAIGYFAFPDNLALLTRMITIALLVLSLDLVTGYCGVATLGHAALFGSGAYAAGILSAHYGINDPLLMMLAGVAGGAVAGLLCGAIILRAHALPQLVLSIALINLFHEFANKASSWTGGSDGLSGIAPDPVFGLFEFDLYGHTAFFFGMALLLIVFVLLRVLVRSPFGMLCRAIKQDPLRIRAMGASPKAALIRMYAISGAIAGVGGALNAISTQVVGLDSLSFTQSAEALVMLVLGGTGSLFGALSGTVIFMLFEDYVSAANPFHWLTMVGALLIAVVLFAPKGLYGTAATFIGRRREQRS